MRKISFLTLLLLLTMPLRAENLRMEPSLVFTAEQMNQGNIMRPIDLPVDVFNIPAWVLAPVGTLDVPPPLGLSFDVPHGLPAGAKSALVTIHFLVDRVVSTTGPQASGKVAIELAVAGIPSGSAINPHDIKIYQLPEVFILGQVLTNTFVHYSTSVVVKDIGADDFELLILHARPRILIAHGSL